MNMLFIFAENILGFSDTELCFLRFFVFFVDRLHFHKLCFCSSRSDSIGQTTTPNITTTRMTAVVSQRHYALS